MILVTGGFGCIGAELVKWLIRHTSEEVLVASRSVNAERTSRTFYDVDIDRLRFTTLDVSDLSQLKNVFQSHAITRIAHLAALQTPDCNANKDLGLQINLAATQHILETAKQLAPNLQRFVYASSIAVYGPRASYPQQRVPESAVPNPVNVYGIWKLASEYVVKLYSEQTGVPAVSLRPCVLFGPGRDLGLTSTPTTAMKAAALGLPYTIPFCSKQDYSYAPDVGAAFGHALMQPYSGYGAYTLPSTTLSMSEVVETMYQAADEVELPARPQIDFGENEVPFICDLEFGSIFEAFPELPGANFHEGVKATLQTFRDFVDRGWITPDSLA